MRESRKSFIQHKKGRIIKHSQWWRYQQERREQERQEQERALKKLEAGKMNEKQPEEIMRQVLELEKELKTIKSRTERPIPVVRDRQGRKAKDLTLKEWFAKLDEEVNEVKIAANAKYSSLEDVPGRYFAILEHEEEGIAGEICDVIKVLYSMAAQMGIDGDYLDKAMHECNEKTRRRGCHE